MIEIDTNKQIVYIVQKIGIGIKDLSLVPRDDIEDESDCYFMRSRTTKLLDMKHVAQEMEEENDDYYKARPIVWYKE